MRETLLWFLSSVSVGSPFSLSGKKGPLLSLFCRSSVLPLRCQTRHVMLILSRQRVKSPDLLPGDLLGQFDEERMSERDMNLERGFPPLTAAEWAILLRHVRQHMHRSQFEAAELLNVGASTYKKWEEGKLVPRPYHRRQIRDILSDEIQTLASLGLLDSRLNIVRLRPVHEGAETETPLISGQRHNELSIVLSSDDPQALPALILTQEDIVSLSKGGELALSLGREREKSATKTDDAIVHEDAEPGGRVPLQLQRYSQKKEPDEICAGVDD
jgi:DNA-binding transcriptional regulator YiaG